MSRIIPGGFLRLAQNLADLKDAAAARLNLGLGDAATANQGAGNGLDADTLDGQEAAAFAAAGHTHTAAEALPVAADGIGAYAYLEAGTASGVATFGAAVAGTELLHLDGTAVVTPSTWQCQGDSPAQGAQTLWLRTA